MKTDRKLDEIKKGPWKAEEDEVLISHVKKYGPRDWSSIRSKGLLQRTGKSCRLRWVNKLRPNLKNGCKFSAEEERTVIELQGQFGNKWARIATYLPGRTDNDVKNFWSSRQKRLARILHNSNASSSTNSKSHRFNNPKSGLHVPHDSVNCPEVVNLGSAGNEVSSSITEMYPSSYYTGPPSESVALMPLPDLAIKPELQPPAYETNLASTDTFLCPDSQNHYLFPQMTAQPQPPPQPQNSIGFSPESQELLARLDDPYFYDIFGAIDSTDPFPLSQPFFEPLRSCRRDEPDVFFDDLPTDMFDQGDSIRSPVD